MSTKVTYIECPDYGCKKWYSDKINCLYDCKKKEKLVKLVKCWACEEVIKLPYDRSLLKRINHKCPTGLTPFILESGTLITLREKIEDLV